VNEAQASYAIARARVEVRLAELREALRRHELGQRWEGHRWLEHVEAALAALVQDAEER
jgi:hypothetical protein